MSDSAIADRDAPAPSLPPTEIRAGRIGDRYELLGWIGAGAMGTVYRAADRELGERVALKMLGGQNASGHDADRLREEVRLARRVTHRNVVRTFDIGEHEGVRFLTMELVDGEMLRAVLRRAGRLPIAEAVRIGIEIAAGLQAAHEAGVLHCDLKPENVILARDGRVVLTDFGIARALRTSDGAADQPSGSPLYMAPEHLGNLLVSVRTDLYSLGIVLFELLAGHRPWHEETQVRRITARVSEPPPDVSVVRPSVPHELAALVARCMATDPDDRFASAYEVRHALEQLQGVPASASAADTPSLRQDFVRASVGVLPLEHRGDAAQRYLAEGVMDDIAEVLGTLPELLVVHAPAASLDARAAGRALGVNAVATGTFEVRDGHAVIALQLVTVEDGFEVWKGTFERPLDALEGVGVAAAEGLAAALSARLPSFSPTEPTDRVAYDLFLRGRAVFHRGWYDAQAEALGLLGDAHELAPGNPTIAAAYARAIVRAYGVSNDNTGWRRAATAAERAVSLAPTRGDARVPLAMWHLYRGDGVGAAQEAARALALAPSDVDALELVGRIRAEVGPSEVAEALLESALARAPGFAVARHTLARVVALRGDYAALDRLLAQPPTADAERVPYYLTHARFALWRGDAARAVELLEATRDFPREEMEAMHWFVDAVRGEALSTASRARLHALFPTGAAVGARRAAFNAQVCAEVLSVTGERDAAVEAVLEADANGLFDRAWMDGCPAIDAIRGLPAVVAAARRVALRAERVQRALAEE